MSYCVEISMLLTATRETVTSGNLFQVKPLLDGIRSNYLRLEQEQNQSIDEQIILPRPNVERHDSSCLKRFTNGSSKT